MTISTQEKLDIIANLATLLSAGIPLLESVDSLLNESKGNTQKILAALKQDLTQGKSISQSFEKSPKAFDPITVNLIKAAEEAGTLDTTLKDLTSSLKKDIEFVGKVKSALIYPMLVFIVLLAVVILNLFFVIPRVATVFEKLKVPTPLPTKILIETSKVVTQNTILIIAGIIILAIFVYFIFKVKKQLFLNILFSLPGISKLMFEIDLTRFTRVMSFLLKSGLPIDNCLELSTHLVLKKQVQDIVANSLKQVTSGKNIAEGLKLYPKIIPNFMIRVVEAGEKSGTLEKSFEELSEQFDSRVSTRLKTLTTLIEPLLLLIVGVMVGAIMLAIIAPIYKLIGNINPRGQ